MRDDNTNHPHIASFCQTRGDPELAELARNHGLSPAAAEAVAAIDTIMAQVRRSMQRREFGRQILVQMGSDLELTHLDAISAIGWAPPDQAGEEMTVGLLAERLGIDPSRASRVAADVVERGYVRRVASQADARRICLELTERGRRFTDAIRSNKWHLFARNLSQWSEHDLVTFAALFERFSSWATDREGIARTAAEIKRRFEEAEAEAGAAEVGSEVG